MNRKATLNSNEFRSKSIGLAAKLVIENNYLDAKEVFNKLLELSPNDVEVMVLLANVHFIEGDLKKSEEWLDKVFLINPNYPQALYEMGTVYLARAEFDKAIDMFKKSIEFFPKDSKKEIADAYQNLGCSLWEIGRREEAIEAWKTTLKYNPKQKYAKGNLKEFTNEYGMAKSPVGMDDFWAFYNFKQRDYISIKGKQVLNGPDDANLVLKKIMDAWNMQIIDKYGNKLDDMKIKEKKII